MTTVTAAVEIPVTASEQPALVKPELVQPALGQEDPGKKQLEETFQEIKGAFERVAARMDKLSIENAELRQELDQAKVDLEQAKMEKLHIHFEIPLGLNYDEESVSVNVDPSHILLRATGGNLSHFSFQANQWSPFSWVVILSKNFCCLKIRQKKV